MGTWSRCLAGFRAVAECFSRPGAFGDCAAPLVRVFRRLDGFETLTDRSLRGRQAIRGVRQRRVREALGCAPDRRDSGSPRLWGSVASWAGPASVQVRLLLRLAVTRSTSTWAPKPTPRLRRSCTANVPSRAPSSRARVSRFPVEAKRAKASLRSPSWRRSSESDTVRPKPALIGGTRARP